MKSQTTNPPIAFGTLAVNAVAGVSWLEGASADKDGTIYFTDVKNNCIYKYHQGGKATVFKKSANYANGMTIDAYGGLIVCEDGDPESGTPPRITRTDLLTGNVKILADQFEGHRFKGPNDVCKDISGNIYFTDGSRPDFLPALQPEHLPLKFRDEIGTTGVYRINTNGTVDRILTAPAIKQPNGIAVSNDRSKLYLIENDTAPEGLRQLLVFDLNVSGDAGSPEILYDFKPGRSGDGMMIDVNGDLLVAAGLNQLRGTSETLAIIAGIHIFSPEGVHKGLIPIPEDSVTNLVALPSDPEVLFVTAGKTLFQVDRRSARIQSLHQHN